MSSNAALGSYTLNVTDNWFGTTAALFNPQTGRYPSATVGFSVVQSPPITLSVNSGTPGTTVTITGSSFADGLSLDQGSCVITSFPAGLAAPSSSCFIDASGNLYSTQFTVNNGIPGGGYQVNVTGSHGDFGLKGFVVTAFTFNLNPIKGQPGQTVIISGSGATASQNTGCTITSDNPNLVTSPSASVVDSIGDLAGSFIVGANAAGKAGGGPGVRPNNVTLSCGSGNTGFAGFSVLPKITLNPSAAAGNQTVLVTGVGFRADITSCEIGSSNGAGPFGIRINATAACTVTGTGQISGNFKVNPTNNNGQYNMTVTGFANWGGAPNVTVAFAFFQKVVSPFISVSPTETAPGYGTLDGTPITISGGGFPTGSSRSCTLSSTGASVLFASSPGVSCTISPSGTVTASFAVATTATPNPMQALNLNYTIRVTDTVTQPFPPTFPFAETFFSVKPNPTITLTTPNSPPNSGPAGTMVTITITSPTLVVFQPTFDAGTCMISSTPTNIISTPSCFINSAGFLSTTSFVVASGAGSGGYTITVTGVHGDFGTAIFTLTTTSPLTINPNKGSPPLGSLPGTTVTITGTGYSLSDTSCIITQEPNGTNVPYFISALACSVSGGSLSATFVVAVGATNNTVPNTDSYLLKVKGTPAYDFKTINFTVVPRILLTPNSGPGGTQVSVIGSGFKGGFGVAACYGDPPPTGIFPAGQFSAAPSSPFFGSLNQCTRFNDGTISGSFNVSLAAAQGAYLIAANATGRDAAAAVFVVGARLLTVTPDTAIGGTFVSVSGTGFVLQDTSCSLTFSPTTPAVPKTGTNICSITNGNVQASFEVDPACFTCAGVYNVVVTGHSVPPTAPTEDKGYGVFTVAFATTTTATSTVFTSSSTTLTSLSTTTTTTQVSTSLTTTTYQTTGVSTDTSRTFTTTTILAPTTATFTTTFTITTLFGTTVTTVVGTITKTLGQVIRSVETSYSDGLGLLAILILITPWVLRRLLD